MNVLSHADTVATAEWSDLVGELDRWGDAGRVAAFWWRDDDAGAMTPNLGRLLALAKGVPVALAVIPAEAAADLDTALDPFPQIVVLQHGWRHANHVVVGKKSEFPAERPPGEVAGDIATGRARLAAIFGARAAPVFVPPWNRIAAGFVPLLAAAGIEALSVMAPRRGALAWADLAAIDVHVDLVAWNGDRGFIGDEAALGGLVAALRSQRQARSERMAATGILTHHLVMDDATADFLRRLQDLIGDHRAARWTDIREMLQ